LSLSKIRYLGRSISDSLSEIEDGALIIEGTKVPLTPENKEDIEALIDNLRETQQKKTRELETKVEKLEKNLEKVVAAETETLRAERDALSREVKRLKPFDIEEKDRSWSVEQMEVISKLCSEFAIACGKFSVDERLKDDLHLQGKIEALIYEMEGTFAVIRQSWDAKFGWDAE